MAKSNTGLIVLVLVLIVFVGFFLTENQPTQRGKIGNSMSEVINSADKGIDEFREEVKDEIDDNTTSQ